MTQSVPILETLLHPPLGLLQRELITGTFTGSGDLTRADGHLAPFNHVNAYGLTWSIVTIPDTAGFIIGTPTVWWNRIIQVSTVHEDYAGHAIISEYHEFAVEGIYWLWANPGPTLVHYEIPLDIELALYWLVVHP